MHLETRYMVRLKKHLVLVNLEAELALRRLCIVVCFRPLAAWWFKPPRGGLK